MDENGSRTAVETSYADGRLSFDTDHFSVYMVDVVAEPEPGSDGGNGGGSNTGLIIGAVVAVIAVLAVLGFLYMKKQKEQ